jgi:hypothetical protein
VGIGDQRYVALTTLREPGRDVPVRMRVVTLSDGRLGLWGVQDVRHGQQAVQVRACDRRGRPLADSPAVSGSAEVVRSGRYYDETVAKVHRKYGVGGILLTDRTADAVMLVRVSDA